MSTKVQVELQPGYVMPPFCVACGSTAGSWTVAESAYDAKTRTGITLHFPLCDACGQVERTASGWHGRHGLALIPRQMMGRFQRIDKAIHISDYKPVAKGSQPTKVTLSFANNKFGQRFAAENKR